MLCILRTCVCKCTCMPSVEWAGAIVLSVRIVVTTVRSWYERQPTSTSPEVPTWFFWGHRLPLSLYALRVQGKLAGWERQLSGTSGEIQVDRHSLYERAIVTIVTGSSPRLADWYLGDFLLLLLELINGLGKDNDGTSFRIQMSALCVEIMFVSNSCLMIQWLGMLSYWHEPIPSVAFHFSEE